MCVVAQAAYSRANGDQPRQAKVEAVAETSGKVDEESQDEHDIQHRKVEDNSKTTSDDPEGDYICRGNVFSAMNMFMDENEKAKNCWDTPRIRQISENVCVNYAKDCLLNCYQKHSSFEGNAPCRDANPDKKLRNWWYDEQYKTKNGYLCHDMCVVAQAAYSRANGEQDQKTTSLII